MRAYEGSTGEQYDPSEESSDWLWLLQNQAKGLTKITAQQNLEGNFSHLTSVGI